MMTLHGFGSDLVPNEDETGKSIDELLHQDEFLAPELAELLGLPLSMIEHEALSGHLKSFIVDHHVIGIRREDALDWLANRG